MNIEITLTNRFNKLWSSPRTSFHPFTDKAKTRNQQVRTLKQLIFKNFHPQRSIREIASLPELNQTPSSHFPVGRETHFFNALIFRIRICATFFLAVRILQIWGRRAAKFPKPKIERNFPARSFFEEQVTGKLRGISRLTTGNWIPTDRAIVAFVSNLTRLKIILHNERQRHTIHFPPSHGCRDFQLRQTIIEAGRAIVQVEWFTTTCVCSLPARSTSKGISFRGADERLQGPFSAIAKPEKFLPANWATEKYDLSCVFLAFLGTQQWRSVHWTRPTNWFRFWTKIRSARGNAFAMDKYSK